MMKPKQLPKRHSEPKQSARTILKNLRPWPRLVLGISYLLGVIGIINLIYRENIMMESPSFSFGTGGVVFTLSMVSEGEEIVSSNLLTQNIFTSVFLDDISIYENAKHDVYCFTSFYLVNRNSVPVQLALETIVDNPVGGSFDQSGRFILKEPLCLKKGTKSILPHIFLGYAPTNIFADLQLAMVNGERALDYFPFDEQRIELNVVSQYLIDDQLYSYSPNLVVTYSQKGWVGVYDKTPDQKNTLYLSRPSFYKVAIIASASMLSVVIIVLSNIIAVAGGYFEVMFGLLVGMGGLRAILLPSYIETSIPVDVLILVFFLIILGEIVAVAVYETMLISIKNSLRIKEILSRNGEDERIIIENPGHIPIDMAGWSLSDKDGILFKFPSYVLKAKSVVNIGVIPTEQFNLGLIDGDYINWGERRHVRKPNRLVYTVYLQDSEDKVINSYTKYRNQKKNRRLHEDIES